MQAINRKIIKIKMFLVIQMIAAMNINISNLAKIKEHKYIIIE